MEDALAHMDGSPASHGSILGDAVEALPVKLDALLGSVVLQDASSRTVRVP